MNPKAPDNIPEPSEIDKKIAWINSVLSDIVKDDIKRNQVISIFRKHLQRIPKHMQKVEFLDTTIQKLLFAIFLDLYSSHTDEEIDAAIQGIPGSSKGFIESVRKNLKFVDQLLSTIDKIRGGGIIPRSVEEFDSPQFAEYRKQKWATYEEEKKAAEDAGQQGDNSKMQDLEKKRSSLIMTKEQADKIYNDLSRAKESGDITYNIRQSLSSPDIQPQIDILLSETTVTRAVPVALQSGVQASKQRIEEEEKRQKEVLQSYQARQQELAKRGQEEQKKIQELQQSATKEISDLANEYKTKTQETLAIIKEFDDRRFSDYFEIYYTGTINRMVEQKIPFDEKTFYQQLFQDTMSEYVRIIKEQYGQDISNSSVVFQENGIDKLKNIVKLQNDLEKTKKEKIALEKKQQGEMKANEERENARKDAEDAYFKFLSAYYDMIILLTPEGKSREDVIKQKRYIIVDRREKGSKYSDLTDAQYTVLISAGLKSQTIQNVREILKEMRTKLPDTQKKQKTVKQLKDLKAEAEKKLQATKDDIEQIKKDIEKEKHSQLLTAQKTALQTGSSQ